MPQAARLHDPIAHSYARLGHAVGATVAVAAEAGGGYLAATVGCAAGAGVGAAIGSVVPGVGTLLGAAVGAVVGFGVGFVFGHVAHLVGNVAESGGEALGAGLFEKCGTLVDRGSSNVKINNKPAIRAGIDAADCSKHSRPLSKVMEGAEDIYINTFRAARVDDHVDCEAKISDGSPDVFFGGPPHPVGEYRSREVPDIDRKAAEWARFIAGMVGGVKGGIKCFLGAIGVGWLTAQALDKLGLGGFDGGSSAANAMGSDWGKSAANAITGSGYFTGKPVHAVTGAKVLLGDEDTDFELPGALPIVWQRTYVSVNAREGLLGAGWSLPFELELVFEQGKAHFISQQGRDTPFDDLQPGQSYYSAAEGTQISRDTAGHYYVSVPSAGWMYAFGPRSSHAEGERLTMLDWSDRNGNAIVYRRDDAGLVREITDTSGHRLALTYATATPAAQTRLTQVDLIEGATRATLVRYAYSTDGDLASVTDRLGVTVKRFKWRQHMMVEQQLASGLLARYQWDRHDANGRVQRHWLQDPSGAMLCDWTFDYSQAGERPGDRRTQITDRILGRISQFDHDSDQNVTRVCDPLGNVTRYEWDHNRNLTAMTRPGGQRFSLSYDVYGNLVQATDPLGQMARIVWHERLQVPLVMTAVDGTSWRYVWDERGNLITFTDAQGQSEHFNCDARGLLTEYIDAKGGRKTYSWSAQGQLQSQTDCSGQRTEHHYDQRGYYAGSTDAMGQRSTCINDALGRPLSITLPDASVRGFAWDAAGRLAHTHDDAGRASAWHYDALDRLRSLDKPDGQRIVLAYDAAQRLSQLVNENNTLFEFSYDAADRLTEEKRPGGQRMSLEHDANGWPIAVTQHPGIGDEIRAGLATQDQSPEYRIGDNKTGLGQPLRTELIRDAVGRLIEKRTAQHHNRYRYDAVDRLLSASRFKVLGQKQTEGQPPQFELQLLHTVAYQYDKLGNCIEETVTDGQSGQSHTLKHSHDELGNRTQTVLPALPGQEGIERALNYLHYGSGHLHQIEFSKRDTQKPDEPAQRQTISNIERDSLHRETLRTQGAATTRYAWDPVGRRIGAWSQGSDAPTQPFGPQDSGAPAWQKAVRAAGTPEHNPLDGLIKAYAYDKAGELRQSRHSLHGNAAYQYDAAGRITQRVSKDFSGGIGTDEVFGYDPAGNIQDNATRLAAERATASSQRGYVKDNLVRVYEDKRFYYDGHGRLIKKLTARHTVQLFEWDDESHLAKVTTIRRPGTEHQTTQTVTFDYDAIGRRIARHDSFGTTAFIWEGMRLIEERRGSSVISYVYEPGSYVPLARIDAEGDRTEQGGLGTAQDAKPEEQQNQSEAANDDTMEGRYWASLRAKGLQKAKALGLDLEPPKPPPKLCNIYYFHNDVNGCPEELTNEQGQIVWQATYKTWGSTVTEEWEVRELDGGRSLFGEGDKPQREYRQQNLRFQGQYLDRDTGLHYNTFRYYDSDVGRFISPDPIGLAGGLNLHSYSPNPISWIDPWGWAARSPEGSYTYERTTTTGGEVNHSPARASYEGVPGAPSYGQAPAYPMDTPDHRGMSSTGSSANAQQWRQQQAAYIQNGRWDRAMEMDIKESINKFGNKYKGAMARMIGQAENLGLITKRQFNKLSKLCK